MKYLIIIVLIGVNAWLLASVGRMLSQSLYDYEREQHLVRIRPQALGS